MSRGWFENYETPSVRPDLSEADRTRAEACLSDPVSCFEAPPPRSLYDTDRPIRWYIESRILLKYAYLGFDINTGSGRDDVRFIAGLTVALDRFFRRPEG